MKTMRLVKLFTFGCIFLACSPVNATMTDFYSNTRHRLSAFTLDSPHWYVSGNIGMSHLYDSSTPGLNDSVNQNGPGWDVDGGYQWNSIFGGELGYTQYYNSRETSGNTNVANTQHYAVHLAATGRYPLANQWSILGKLGVAYSYANKTFTGVGLATSSGAVAPYAGIGIAYSMTPRADLTLQCANAFGNSSTGSSTLFSLGMTFAII